MVAASLKSLGEIELSPAEQALLERLRGLRWNIDRPNNRWCVLIKGEDVLPVTRLVSKLEQQGVAHAPVVEDHNAQRAAEWGKWRQIATQNIGSTGMASSGLTSMVLALDEESLRNLGIEIEKAADITRRKARKPTTIILR